MTSQLTNYDVHRRDGVRSGRLVARGHQFGRHRGGDPEFRVQDQLQARLGENREGETPVVTQVAQVTVVAMVMTLRNLILFYLIKVSIHFRKIKCYERD